MAPLNATSESPCAFSEVRHNLHGRSTATVNKFRNQVFEPRWPRTLQLFVALLPARLEFPPPRRSGKISALADGFDLDAT